MRILVIEDERTIRESLKSGLEAECFSVDVAEDGEKGSYMARTNPYDLIILDNVLPKKLGSQICEELRQLGKHMPIIALTVQGEIPKKVNMLNVGADDYLTKPFSFQELLARIRALLRRPRSMESNTLTLGDLSIDVTNHTVKRGGRDIYLTKKEFELLEYLMRSKGKVLSRSAIMEHVWDMNADPFSNTLETHILNLRRKLNAGNEPDLIRTLSGRGYKIDIKN